MSWNPALRLLIVPAAALLLASCASVDQSVLRQADKALGGATTLKTLRFAGSGTGATFGQAYQPGMAWPQLTYSSFSRVLDFENEALREDYARARAEPTGGGALPLMGTGEQRGTGMLRGTYAWNMAGPAPVASPLAADGRIHDLWTSPHGVIRAALKNKATVRPEGARSVVSFSEPGRFSAVAWINAEGLVERVDSVQPNPVLGDTQTVTLYSDYRDFGGVKFPTRIRQNMGGFPVLDLQVKEVVANQPSGIEVPALVTAAAERVTAEKVADGVWFLGGGSHNSVLVEMKDHLILVESPLFDGRALPVIAEAKKLAPGKDIRYVINSHHHFDHAGGVRAAAAEGATIVTSEQARPWFERVLANPNGISPDALAKSGRKAVVTGVNGQRSFSDGARTVEVFMIEDSVHAQGFMMVWLPRERLLVEADAYTPGPPNTAPPPVANANNVNLAQNIERMKFSVDRILPLHGRVVPVAELYNAIGRKP
ncbi:MAG: MBL fold metallo-hydrolase [Burkholderiales bacterium]|nr:MBL fold metallo-hydrolase [Burkholderiales bacterium]